MNTKLFAGVRNKEEEINWSASEVWFPTKINGNLLNLPPSLPLPPPKKTQNKTSSFISSNNSRNPAVKSKATQSFLHFLQAT